METIIEISDEFDFNQIGLENPTPAQGGTFFTKLKLGEKGLPIYLQLPKATSKHGMVKNSTGTKGYIDLLFENNNKDLHGWIENLEEKCINLIDQKKSIWFESEMNRDDIENMWINSMKPYKSGKFLTLRSNIPISKQTKEPYLILYDEDEREMNLDNLQDDKIRFIPLVHIDGIKFTSKSFHIEYNLRQVMVLTLENSIQKTCIIKNKNIEKLPDLVENKLTNNLEKVESIEKDDSQKNCNIKQLHDSSNTLDELISIDPKTIDKNNDLNEIKLSMLPESTETIDLKKPQEVYLEIYRNTLQKARDLKKAALESFIELKNIKLKYNLQEYLESEDELSDYAELE